MKLVNFDNITVDEMIDYFDHVAIAGVDDENSRMLSLGIQASTMLSNQREEIDRMRLVISEIKRHCEGQTSGPIGFVMRVIADLETIPVKGRKAGER